MTTSPTTTLSAAGRARLVTVVLVVMSAVLVGPAALAGLATAVAPGGCAAAADVHAGLVVDFGDVDTGSPRPADTADCISDPGTNGVTLLARRFGKDHIRIDSSGLICAIDDYPSSGCGERVGDKYRYWSYWKGGSAWQYSQVGPGGRTISDGAVDGWHFVEGSATPSDGPPGNSLSAGPCAPPATAPPSAPPPPAMGGSPGLVPPTSSRGPTAAPSAGSDPSTVATGASDPSSAPAGSDGSDGSGGSSIGTDTATTGSGTDNIDGAENASNVSSGGASGGGGVPLLAIGVALAVVALGGGATMRFRSRTDE